MNKTILVSILGLALCAGAAGCGDDDGGTAGPDAMPPDDSFIFDDSPASAYTRVDRAGMPAVATAVISSKDAYNAADPVDDAAGDFVSEITDNVTALHTALDDDLNGAGLAPCAAAACVNQAAPFVVPDTLKIDTATAAGFPNGRRLGDPVMDVTLALVLLDLSGSGVCGTGTCAVTTFVDIPLNPTANDVAFASSFPFLAAPHTAN